MRKGISWVINTQSGTLTLKFPNGNQTLDLTKLQTEIKVRAALEGLKARVFSTRDMERAISDLQAGRWPGIRRDGTARAPKTVLAIAELTGASVEDTLARWSRANSETKNAWKSDPRIKEHMAKRDLTEDMKPLVDMVFLEEDEVT